jgi:hypothetical protein
MLPVFCCFHPGCFEPLPVGTQSITVPGILIFLPRTGHHIWILEPLTGPTAETLREVSFMYFTVNMNDDDKHYPQVKISCLTLIKYLNNTVTT